MIKIWVGGKPQAWQRVKRGRNGQAYVPKATKAYEELVAWRASDAMTGKAVTPNPVAMQLTFVMPIPKSWTKAKQRDAAAGLVAPTGRPDLSNLIKGVEDALNGIVYKDDSQIVVSQVEKRYGHQAGVEILVEEDIRRIPA